jgi:hypothetical protein
MLVVHGTKKFRDRVGAATTDGPETSAVLGSWYASALLWRPQLALFVHETTLLPVLMPLAPAATVLDRFPDRLAEVLGLHAVDARAIAEHTSALTSHCLVPTASRSLVGSMNEFTYFARAYRSGDGIDDLDELSIRLAQIPCSPLYKATSAPTGNSPRSLLHDGGVCGGDVRRAGRPGYARSSNSLALLPCSQAATAGRERRRTGESSPSLESRTPMTSSPRSASSMQPLSWL